MGEFSRKLAYYYGRGGLRGLSAKVLTYLRDVWWSDECWVIYQFVLSGAVPLDPGSILHKELNFDQLVCYRYFKALDFAATIKRRYAAGAVCHGFFDSGKLVTVGWSTPDYLELDVKVRMTCASSVGLFDFYTYDESRSKGYYTAALKQLILIMRDAGFTMARIAVDPNNIPSIRGIEKAGFLRTMRVKRRRRFGLRYLVRETLALEALH